MSKPKLQPNERLGKGLLGFFGHSYNDDGALEWQFRVIRTVGQGSYAIQLFEWIVGAPSEIVILTEKELSTPKYKLYPDEDAWRHASDEYHRLQTWKEAQEDRRQRRLEKVAE